MREGGEKPEQSHDNNHHDCAKEKSQEANLGF